MLVLARLRVPRRRRDRGQPVRAARAARRSCRPARPAGGAGRSAIVLGLARHLRGHDRRPGERSSTASGLGDERRCATIAIVVLVVFGGSRSLVPGARRPRRGAAVAAGALRAARARRRVLVGPAASAPRSASSTRPCAGPILAAVISVGAASGSTRSRSSLAYALGLGGRAARARARRARGWRTASAAPAAARRCSARSAS